MRESVERGSNRSERERDVLVGLREPELAALFAFPVAERVTLPSDNNLTGYPARRVLRSRALCLGRPGFSIDGSHKR